MKHIVFATNNKHKIGEIENIIKTDLNIKGLKDINCFEEIPEDQDTIEGNALQKARYIFENFKENCFADDTGLEVEALNGEPGVYSARYAGETKDFEANIDKVLEKLKGKENRKARFKTVIALIIDGKENLFEGIVNGKIIEDRKGSDGFGYDSVFLPDTYDKTFAEMNMNEKNKISHRAIAVRKLVEYLNLINKT